MIRQWFNNEESYQKNETNSKLDILLGMCKEGLLRYYKSEETSSLDQLMQELSQKELALGDRLFYEWLQKEGVATLKKLATFDLKEQEYAKGLLEYEIYIFGEELKDFEYPEEVRSCIISIVSYVPEQLENKEE